MSGPKPEPTLRAQQPQMRAFLAANDPAVTPGFTLRKPALIVQETADPFVLEPLQTPFAERLKRSGAPVTYKRYDGADHFTVIRQHRVCGWDSADHPKGTVVSDQETDGLNISRDAFHGDWNYAIQSTSPSARALVSG